MGVASPWLQLGHWAVTLFIVLSGFCLMLPVASAGGLRGGAKGFYAARAKRILPAYWAALAFTLFLVLTLLAKPQDTMFDICLHPTWKGVLSHIFLLNNFTPRPFFEAAGNVQVNSVFWSVSLEWLIYFWFPLYVFMWRRVGPLLSVSAICLMAWGGYQFCQWRGAGRIDWPGFNPDYYAYFALGMLSCHIVLATETGRAPRLPWGFIACALLAGWALLYHMGFSHWLWATPKVLDVYCAPTFAILLIAASQKGPLNHGFSWRPLVRVGEYSYSIYLLHLPLIALLTYYVILPLRAHGVGDGRLFLLLLALSIPTVLFIASRFSLIFENKRVIVQVLERIGLKTATAST